MSASSSLAAVVSRERGRAPEAWVAAAEVVFVFSGLLLYIWRWQHSHPYAWVPLLLVVVASHLVRRESLDTLGLSRRELGPSARIAFPAALLLYIPLLIYGFHRHALAWPTLYTAAEFLGYTFWCAFQQYLMQSYFHNRLMSIFANRHASSVVVALMFGAAHVPNPVLLVVTTLGGWVLAEIYARHRNIWPLALVQAVAGVLIGMVFSPALIHHMRVGPGYYSYRLPKH